MAMPTLTVRLVLPPAYGLRMALATLALRLGAWIAPHDIAVEVTDAQTPEGEHHGTGGQFTTARQDGMPPRPRKD